MFFTGFDGTLCVIVAYKAAVQQAAVGLWVATTSVARKPCGGQGQRLDIPPAPTNPRATPFNPATTTRLATAPSYLELRISLEYLHQHNPVLP